MSEAQALFSVLKQTADPDVVDAIKNLVENGEDRALNEPVANCPKPAAVVKTNVYLFGSGKTGQAFQIGSGWKTSGREQK